MRDISSYSMFALYCELWKFEIYVRTYTYEKL